MLAPLVIALIGKRKLWDRTYPMSEIDDLIEVETSNTFETLNKFPLSETELYDLSSYMLSLKRDGDTGSITGAFLQALEPYLKRG